MTNAEASRSLRGDGDQAVPLVFVPGAMGSKLWADDAFQTRLWLPDRPFARRGARPDLPALVPLGDRRRKVTRTQEAGLVDGAYPGLLHALQAMGYYSAATWDPAARRFHDQNLFVFAYDWTAACAESGDELAAFIGALLARNRRGWTQVDVINHSLGGLLTRQAQRSVAGQIRRVVYLNAPHWGMPLAYFLLHPGIRLGLRDLIAENGVTQPLLDVWRPVLRLLSENELLTGLLLDTTLKRLKAAVFDQLPDASLFAAMRADGDPLPPMVQLPGAAAGGAATVDETYYRDPLSRLPEGLHAEVRRAMAFKQALGRDLRGEHLVVYSDGVPTCEYVRYVASRVRRGFAPVGRRRDGDGTAPGTSLRGSARDPRRTGGTHSTAPNGAEAHRLIRAFLTAA